MAVFLVYGIMMLMIIVALGFLGLLFGSFVNAFVWRLHEQETLAEQSKRSTGKSKRSKKTLPSTLTPSDLSIMKGRSMCPDCHHTLAAKDLVPVFSWLSLKGKCRYCVKPISWQYPLVELLTALLFVISYLCWPFILHSPRSILLFAIWLVFLVAFMALAVYDLRWFLLPDKLVFPLIGLATAQVIVVAIWQHSFSLLWEPALAGVVFFGFFWLLFQISAGRWIGGGDVKLAAVLGLLVGTPLKVFLAIFLSSLIGTVISIPLLVRGKQNLKLHIPFGPYLLIATVVIVLYGSNIISWYENLILI